MNIHTPQRLEGESYEAYQQRRKMAQRVAKFFRKGEKPTLFVQHQPNGGLATHKQQLKDIYGP